MASMDSLFQSPWMPWLGVLCAVGMILLIWTPIWLIKVANWPRERPAVRMLKEFRSQVIDDLQAVTAGNPIDGDRESRLREDAAWIRSKLAILEKS
jgi:hypothetical protein